MSTTQYRKFFDLEPSPYPCQQKGSKINRRAHHQQLKKPCISSTEYSYDSKAKRSTKSVTISTTQETIIVTIENEKRETHKLTRKRKLESREPAEPASNISEEPENPEKKPRTPKYHPDDVSIASDTNEF